MKLEKRNSIDYNCKIDDNVHYLQHLINCLKGEKEQSIIEKTITQLEDKIKSITEEIKTNEENGKL